MPLYEYECANGHRFENIQKFSDPPVTACPTCDAPVQKLMSSPAFQFKGTGWYITDYAKKDAGPGKDTQAGSSDTKDTKTDAKTETKSDTAAAATTASKPASADPKT